MFVQAHRGFSSAYPELTLLSFEKAIAAGAERIEMDLALTADGEVVLIHDPTLERTTSGTGRVDAHSLAEIKALDAGSWKSPAFAGERVPTLDEVLERVDGRAHINLELKIEHGATAHLRELVSAAVASVHAFGGSPWTIFSSFSMRSLQAVRDIDPALRLLLIDWSDPAVSDRLELAIDKRLYGWTPLAPYASEPRIRRATAAGLVTHVATAPHPRILEWADWGLGGVSGDDPAALTEYLDRMGLR